MYEQLENGETTMDSYGKMYFTLGKSLLVPKQKTVLKCFILEVDIIQGL